MSGKKRVLFFDIARIVCIALIVYQHFPFESVTRIFYPDGMSQLVVYPNSIGLLAVYGIIFVSGAVLELNYSGIKTVNDYIRFVIKRCIRIYPAYWLSLIVSLLCIIVVIPDSLPNLSKILLEFSGFYYFTGLGRANLSEIGWFIGTIVLLYLLFPLLSRYIKKYPVSSMVFLTLVTFISRYYLITFGGGNYRVLPICNLFEFALGILIVQKGLYPKNEGEHPYISKISDLTFYIFLVHLIVLQNVRLFNLTFVHVWTDWPIYYTFVTAAYILVATVIMIIDERIQREVRSRFRL